jgi:hypothetical protein
VREASGSRARGARGRPRFAPTVPSGSGGRAAHRPPATSFTRAFRRWAGVPRSPFRRPSPQGPPVTSRSSPDFDITFVQDRIQKPLPSADGTFPEKDDFRLNFGVSDNFWRRTGRGARPTIASRRPGWPVRMAWTPTSSRSPGLMTFSRGVAGAAAA